MKTIGLVPAHHRGGNGVRRPSLATVNGKPAVAEVIACLKSIPQMAEVVTKYSAPELRAILERHFACVKILSSKSGGRLSEDCDSGQKMVALCR